MTASHTLKRKPILDKAVEMLKGMNRWPEVLVADTVDVIPDEFLNLSNFCQIAPGGASYTYRAQGANILEWTFRVALYNAIEFGSWTIGGVEGEAGLVEIQDSFYDLFYDNHSMDGVVDRARLQEHSAPELLPIQTRSGELAGMWVAVSIIGVRIERGR